MKLYKVYLPHDDSGDETILADKNEAEKRLAYLKLTDEEYEMVEIDDARKIEYSMIYVEGNLNENGDINWFSIDPLYADDVADESKHTDLTFGDTGYHNYGFYGIVKFEENDTLSGKKDQVKYIIKHEFEKCMEGK